MLEDRLRAVLESTYQDYHLQERRSSDAVHWVHDYEDSRDREVVAFFSALLAYGNVTTILNSIRRFLDRLPDTPYLSVINRRFEDKLGAFRHRFTTGEDLEILCHQLASILERHESLEAFFLAGTEPLTVDSFGKTLASFVSRLHATPLPKGITREHRARSLKYLVSSPNDGSACKRLNLFLRWMVRPNDGIDFGQWKRVSPSVLRLPVDTHLLRVLRELRWTQSKTANWRVVEAATHKLRQMDPSDPVRFDFSLCHLSMQGFSIRQYLKGEKPIVPAKA
ncbi:MAG: TIGR02757 family protein [Bdellovibrionaceae bacterium]|nr:TIGR02757 family protein [Bdellovibrionales bacterium]MCB9253441.1 TIGR02757 family protein [Pseudobdellovibrionaceae bacterium]